jgi:hypothetical protein
VDLTVDATTGVLFGLDVDLMEKACELLVDGGANFSLLQFQWLRKNLPHLKFETSQRYVHQADVHQPLLILGFIDLPLTLGETSRIQFFRIKQDFGENTI